MDQPVGKGEKKSIWASVKGAFVEEVPEGHPEAPTGTPAPQHVESHPAIIHSVDDGAARKRLEAAIESSAPPGYVELQDTLSTLADSIPDESARWKAAMKLAAKHGHSVEILLGDFDKCIGILEQKGREFEDETQAQLKRKVGGRQATIESLDTQIKTKHEQIQQLQSDISRLSEQRDAESAALTADEQKITSVKEGFVAAYQVVHAQLTDRRNKLATFGKV